MQIVLARLSNTGVEFKHLGLDSALGKQSEQGTPGKEDNEGFKLLWVQTRGQLDQRQLAASQRRGMIEKDYSAARRGQDPDPIPAELPVRAAMASSNVLRIVGATSLHA